MSARLVPRYEYCDAGDDAIASSVPFCAVPKPTAKTVMSCAFTAFADTTAAFDPPYWLDCCPSVSRKTTQFSPEHGRPPAAISRDPVSSPDEMDVHPPALRRPEIALPTSDALPDSPISVRAELLNSTTATRVSVDRSSN